MPDARTTDAAAWIDHVFCMITPDSLRRRLAWAILERFQGIGLTVAGWQLLRVTARQNDIIAAAQGAGADSTYRYRAIDALFDLGPTLALRLRDCSSLPDEIYRRAQCLKGASDPRDLLPGTIRHDLGALNTVMSLLHVSDSPGNSARESAVILSGIDGPPFLDAASLGSELRLVEAGWPAEARGFRDVLSAVRSRLVASLWGLLSEKGQALAAELHQQGGLADPHAGQLLAAELGPAGEHHPLAEVLRATFDPSQPPVDMRYTADLLALHGIGLDPWEHAVLATSMYFEPV